MRRRSFTYGARLIATMLSALRAADAAIAYGATHAEHLNMLENVGFATYSRSSGNLTLIVGSKESTCAF
jgi:hypothetical protein